MREKETVVGTERWRKKGKDSDIHVWDKWHKNTQVITVILWLVSKCSIHWCILYFVDNLSITVYTSEDNMYCENRAPKNRTIDVGKHTQPLEICSYTIVSRRVYWHIHWRILGLTSDECVSINVIMKWVWKFYERFGLGQALQSKTIMVRVEG